MRRSDIAYVIIALRKDGEDHLLLHRHAKWGDWSLVGGHVEPGEEHDWLVVARREAGEELAPLRAGEHFEVERIPLSLEWGPEPSRSAHGEPTYYHAEYFVLRFTENPVELLRRLPSSDFRLVRLRDLRRDEDVCG